MATVRETQKQQQGLQTLTDSPVDNMGEPISTKKLVTELCQKHPVPKPNASRSELNQHRNTIIDGLIDHPSTDEHYKADLRSQVWEYNHLELMVVMNRFMTEHNRVPTVSDLAVETGLSRMTIYKHLGDFIHSSGYQVRIEQFQLMAPQVLTKLYNLAVRGDVKAAKVYLDVVGGLPSLNQVAPVNQGATNTNYIQVNNNVKIDQLTFTTLPQDVRHQIANLVLQGLQTASAPSDSGS